MGALSSKLQIVLQILSAIFLLLFTAVISFTLWIRAGLPDYEALKRYEPPVSSRIYAHDGSIIAEFAQENRVFVSIDRIPKLLLAAFIAAEDPEFFEHGGQSIRAMRVRIMNKVGLRRDHESAFTITQKVASNMLVAPSQSTFARAVQEALLAVRLDRTYSKERILELYLNELYFGEGAYGIAAASLEYFNKELIELTIEECAYLAALARTPKRYHPILHPSEARERRNWVIDRLVSEQYILADHAPAAKAKPLQTNRRPFGRVLTNDHYIEGARKNVVALLGADALNRNGLAVHTSYDNVLQPKAREALLAGLVEADRLTGWRGPLTKISITGDWGIELSKLTSPNDIPWRLGVVLEVSDGRAIVGLRPIESPGEKLTREREAVEILSADIAWLAHEVAGVNRSTLEPGDVVFVGPVDKSRPQGRWTLYQMPRVTGGIVAMDPHTGRVRAALGGHSFEVDQRDMALEENYFLPSAIAPLVYAAALDNGYNPASRLPRVQRKGLAATTLRLAMENSRPEFADLLAEDLGATASDYLERWGVRAGTGNPSLQPYSNVSTTLVTLVAAYATFVNGGMLVQPKLVEHIKDRWGEIIWRHDRRACEGCKSTKWDGSSEPTLADYRKQLIDPRTAFQITSMMHGAVLRGNSSIVGQRLPGAHVAGNGAASKDKGLFIGFTPDLVVGVVVEAKHKGDVAGDTDLGRLASLIFASFIESANADRRWIAFRVPSGLVFKRIRLETGSQIDDAEPNTILEAFKLNEKPDE